MVLIVKFEREKFYPGPGIEPGHLGLRASALPLRHPGQLPIQGRINLFVPRVCGGPEVKKNWHK